MNFFQAQEDARRRSAVLILYFMASLIVLIFISYIIFAIFAVIVSFFQYSNDTETLKSLTQLFYRLDVFLLIVAISIAPILYLIYSKHKQLRVGGVAVAKMLKAELLSRQGLDAKEHQLLNIVEEMSIAAEIPVPQVFLLRAKQINAFTAGYSTNDAVIGVTKGALENLTREELQGVIAHEFSHILNGDMKINTWMISIIFGLSAFSNGSVYRQNGNEIEPIGLVWVGFGYFGSILASVMKRKVIYEREFLADASAVQFTRNASAIAGALTKVDQDLNRLLETFGNPYVGHMMFAGITERFMHMHVSSHPTIEERLNRLESSKIATAK